MSDITSNLLAHWKLDDATGTSAVDSSGNNNTGTLVNTPSWTTGKLGGGLQFTLASSQKVNAPTIAALDSAAAVTIAFWGKRTSTSNTMAVGANGVSNLFNIAVWTGSTLYSQVGVAYGSVAHSTINQFVHYCMVFDGAGVGNAARLKTYVDGVAQTLSFSGTVPATIGTNAAHGVIEIGHESGGYSTGIIDEVRVYSRALSAGDVTDLVAYTGAVIPQISHHRRLMSA